MKIIHQQLTSIRRIISLVLRHFGFLEPNTILKVRLSQWWRSTGLIMTSIIALAVAVSFSMDDSVFATAPTLTVTIPENIVSISVAPASADGTFVESDDLDFSVTTDNYSGYNLTIKAASATNLVSGTDVLATLPSGSSLTAEAFEGGANYINKWGYKPSKLNSVANSTYRPSPSTTTGDVIENRNTAGTNIPYTISIGAKVDLTQPIGEYSNTFVITAVANLTSYTITYDANDGNSGNDTTNMPATNPQTGNADPSSITSVTLASAPTRSGFDFMGWCTVQVADDAACTGTEYAAADTYDINFQGTNTFTLYARWAEARQSLYDTVAAMSKGMQTNDANASTGIQAAIVAPTEAAPISSNSGVYEYNATVFGASSDDTDSCTRADNCPIYYYRGILDSYGHTGSYGSDGLADAYPNYVILQSGSSKATTDTCWRIVRTTGSGGVKMIYNGKWTGSTCANATTNAQVITSAFNNSSASNGYTSLAYQNIHAVGYTYNDDVNGVTTASADTTIAKVLGSNDDYNVNDSDSIIKQYIEKTWFTNISAYQSILETSAGYCNDRSMYPNGSYGLANKLAETTQIVPYGTSGMTIYYFGAYTRNMNAAQAPTLNCPRGTVDIYSVSGASTGNGQLAKPASLLTADELSFAGSGRSTASQGSSYHANSYLRSGSVFWLLSPSTRGSNGSANEFVLSSDGSLGGYYVNRTRGVRPAISLTSGTTASGGSGTATDPWVVTAP